jgi:hypothetical protein
VSGAVGLGQELDLRAEAAVVHLGGLPAAGVVDEVVQVMGSQAEVGGPGGQLVRLAGLGGVPGRAGAGEPAGAGQEDGLGFQAVQAAGGAVQLGVLGDDVRPQAGDDVGPAGVFLGVAWRIAAPGFFLASRQSARWIRNSPLTR